MGGYGMPEWIRVSVGTPEQNDRCLREIGNLRLPGTVDSSPAGVAADR
jgi:hypothetical protein